MEETDIPAFKLSGVLLSIGPTQILRNYFPIWIYRAAKGSALVATPVLSLCQSSVFSASNMSVRYPFHKHMNGSMISPNHLDTPYSQPYHTAPPPICDVPHHSPPPAHICSLPENNDA